MSSDYIYLDYAAATPVDGRVLAAMKPFQTELFYNPSATYLAALNVRHQLDAARAKVAHWLGARPSEVVFTAGGTEANNLAVHGVMRQFPEANILVSAVEHESVLAPAHEYNCQEVAVKPDGGLDVAALKRELNDKTVLISVMYANNEVGTLQPVKEIARLVADERQQRRRDGNELPLYFHADACQAANYLDLHVSRLGVDLMTLNGGKIYGPKQSGVLYVKAGLPLRPLISGGGQEKGLRSGTENVAAAVGLATALEIAQTMRHQETDRLQQLQGQFIKQLEDRIPTAVINGSQKTRLPNNIHLTLPGQDNERLLMLLDQAGILAAAGSACSASDEEPSHVLKAMGLTDAEAQSSLRFTMGRGTTPEMIGRTVEALSRFVAQN